MGDRYRIRLTVDGTKVTGVSMDEPKRDLKDLLLHGSGNAAPEPPRFEFTAEDFGPFGKHVPVGELVTPASIARVANARLAEMLAAAPDLYCWRAESFERGEKFWKAIEIEPANNEYTHRARLVAIRREEKT